MVNNLGYTKNLFILPFDHRGSFEKEFEKETISDLKQIIYEAFEKAVSGKISKDKAAILVDEQYGSGILIDAKRQGFNIVLTTEKSGEEGFEFEYGEEFGQHIEKYKPSFAKALIRYKPDQDFSRLRLLSNFCHDKTYKFLLEVLLNSQNALNAIDDLRVQGIEPDVWKLEGMESKNAYMQVVSKIQEDGRENVGLVILGRGENEETVKKWIVIGAKVKGVIGFAVGRTIFLQPLKNFRDGTISRDQAVEITSKKFIYFYNLFIGKAT